MFANNPLVLQGGGYTLTSPNCLCIAPDASRALLAHNAVSHRGVLLCAAGPTGEFTRVAFPEGWGAPRACSWSPMGGALGTATSDETCLLAVACGTRVGLCARMATLHACLKAQVPGPASDPAWYPTGLPYSKHWAVLPLDLGEGGRLQQKQAQQAHQQLQPKALEEGVLGEGEPATTSTTATTSIPPQPSPSPTFTALCWSPRLYRNPVGARSYLALGTSMGTLSLVRVSCFNPKLWHPDAPPHPAQGPDSARGFVECVTVGKGGVGGDMEGGSGSGSGGGGVGITAMTWFGGGAAVPPSCLVVGCEDGSVHLCPFKPAREATPSSASSSAAGAGAKGGSTTGINSGGGLWDDGVVFLPPRCLLPPNGSPPVGVLKWRDGVLGVGAGSSLTLLWPESWGALEGGEGGGELAAPLGGDACQGWDVVSVRVEGESAQGTRVVEGLRGCTVRNAHSGSITGLHLGACASSSGGSGSNDRGDGTATTHAFTTSLDGTVRKWSLATLRAWCINTTTTSSSSSTASTAASAPAAPIAVKSKKRGSSSSSSSAAITTTTSTSSSDTMVPTLVTQLSTSSPKEGFKPLPRGGVWLPPLYGLAGDDVGLSLITAGAGFGGNTGGGGGGGCGGEGGGMSSASASASATAGGGGGGGGNVGGGGGGVGGKQQGEQMELSALSAHSMQMQATASLHVSLLSIPLHPALAAHSHAQAFSGPSDALKRLLQAAAVATGAARTGASGGALVPSFSSSSSSSSSASTFTSGSLSSSSYLPSHTIHEGPGVLCASLYPLPYAKARRGALGASAPAAGGGGGSMGAPAVHWDTVSLCHFLDACGRAAIALGRQGRAQELLEARQLGVAHSSSSSSSSSSWEVDEEGEKGGRVPVYLPLHKQPPMQQQHKAPKVKAAKKPVAAAAAVDVDVDDMGASVTPLDAATTPSAGGGGGGGGEEGAKKKRRKRRKVSASRSSSHPPPPLSTTHWATATLPDEGKEVEAWQQGHFSPFSTRLMFDAAAEGVREVEKAQELEEEEEEEGGGGQERERLQAQGHCVSTRIRTVISTALRNSSLSSSPSPLVIDGSGGVGDGSGSPPSRLSSQSSLHWELAYPLVILQCLANACDGSSSEPTTRASLHLALHLTRHILKQAHQAVKAGVVAVTASYTTAESGGSGSGSGGSSSATGGGSSTRHLPTAAVPLFSGGVSVGSSSSSSSKFGMEGGDSAAPPPPPHALILSRACHGPHPPRWVWYAAAIAPRLCLWARSVSLVAALDSRASAPARWIPGPHRGAFKRGALWATWALGVRVATTTTTATSSSSSSSIATEEAGNGIGSGSGSGSAMEGLEEELRGEERDKEGGGEEAAAVAEAVASAVTLDGGASSPLSPSLLKGLQRVQAALVFTTEDGNSGTSNATADASGASASASGGGTSSGKKSDGREGKGGKSAAATASKKVWEEPIPPFALLSPLTWSHWSLATTPPHAAVIAGALALCSEE